MPLTDAIAESIGQEIATALDALPKGEDKSAEAWKTAVKKIFAGIVANGQVTVITGAIDVATTGSPTAQSGAGPSAPVILEIS